MIEFTPQTTLCEAKAHLVENMARGVICPTCTQHVKLYRRPINSQMARSLISLHLAVGRDWGHWPTIIQHKHADEGKLRHWGLVEESSEPREDGGRAGWWRITDRGVDFVLGRTTVQKYVLIFDSECYGFEGEQVTIQQALGIRFRYDELMAAGR